MLNKNSSSQFTMLLGVLILSVTIASTASYACMLVNDHNVVVSKYVDDVDSMSFMYVSLFVSIDVDDMNVYAIHLSRKGDGIQAKDAQV